MAVVVEAPPLRSGLQLPTAPQTCTLWLVEEKSEVMAQASRCLTAAVPATPRFHQPVSTDTQMPLLGHMGHHGRHPWGSDNRFGPWHFHWRSFLFLFLLGSGTCLLAQSLGNFRHHDATAQLRPSGLHRGGSAAQGVEVMLQSLSWMILAPLQINLFTAFIEVTERSQCVLRGRLVQECLVQQLVGEEPTELACSSRRNQAPSWLWLMRPSGPSS